MIYSLRFNVHEDSWEQQLSRLIDACTYAHIEEVLLCEEARQIVPVPQSLDYHRRMADIYRQITPVLRKRGIRPSFYFKALAGHGDAHLPPEAVLPFTKFVGGSLHPANATPCLLDPDWQDYAAQAAAIVAQAGFDKLFVDDDFRSINHAGEAVGCFCPLHLAQVNAKLGRSLTQEELVHLVCGGGPDSLTVRRAWMEVTFAGQLEAAKKIGRAVHQICPGTWVGSMNSGEASHSLQGRDMPRLLAAFAEGSRLEGNEKQLGDDAEHRSAINRRQPPLSRPAGSAYGDTFHDGIAAIYQTTAQSIAVQGRDTYYISEVENFPRTLYSKSCRVTHLQMALHTFAGVKELSLNLFDHYDTPFSTAQEYLDLLRENKPVYDRIQELIRDKEPVGVAFPWKKDIAAHLTNPSGRLDGLIHRAALPPLLSILGVPVKFIDGDAPLECWNDRVFCLEGDEPLCYTREELYRLLCGERGLILDRIAAKHLCEMGLEELIGVSHPRTVDYACYERMDDPAFSGAYVGQVLAAWLASVGDQENAPLQFELLPGARAAGHLLDRDKQPFAPAVSLYENALGGRVAVFAAPVSQAQNWLYKCRSTQLRRIVSWLGRNEIVCITDGTVNLIPLVRRNPNSGEILLCLVNAGLDETYPQLLFPAGMLDAFSGLPVDRPCLPPLTAGFYLLPPQ